MIETKAMKLDPTVSYGYQYQENTLNLRIFSPLTPRPFQSHFYIVVKRHVLDKNWFQK